MGRLTDKKEADSERREYENRLRNGYPRNIPLERFLCLAAYEDTGLEPEEIDSAFIHEIIKGNARLKSELERLRADPNAPLTLEELREMDGEPVWNDTTKNYMLVDANWWNGIGRAIDSNGKYRLLDDRYYRRKPEEGTT